MALLNEAQLDLYNSNMEQHIVSIVGTFGHIQKPPYQKGNKVLMEDGRIKKKQRRGQSSTTAPTGLGSNDFMDPVQVNAPREEEESGYSDSEDDLDDDLCNDSECDSLIDEFDYSNNSNYPVETTLSEERTLASEVIDVINPSSSNHENSLSEENNESDVNDSYETDLTDNVLFNVQMLHEENLKKVYVDAVDNPNFDLDEFCDYLFDCIYNKFQANDHDNYYSRTLKYLLNYLKTETPEFLRLPRRDDLANDWRISPSVVLKANKQHVKLFFAAKKNIKLHISFILIQTCMGNNHQRLSQSKKVIDLMNMIFKTIEEYFLDALDSKARKEELVDIEYKSLLKQFITKRKQQLCDLGFSEKLVSELIKREHLFFDTRAKLIAKPLPECYLLDQFDDNECFSFFRFDKIMLKYLAVVFNIPKSMICETENPRRNAKAEIVKVDTFEDPTAALSICLARLSSSASLVHMSRILGISSKNISKVNKNVVDYIVLFFSHLLNIDNCTYNTSYLKLLIDKSNKDLLGLKKYTTHMIDGTHTKISKPTKYKNSGYDVTWDGKKQSDTVALQYVTDCLGLFIDVTPAALGAKHDRFLFTSSGIANRLSKLKYKDITFQVVGDSAYVSGTLVYNEETHFFESNNENGCNLYGVPKRGDVRTLDARESQKNISKVRCLIERSFGFRNNLFKSLGTKDRQKLFLNSVSRENMATSIFTNIRQILYSSACSQPFSDVLPVDFYLLMWGALSDRKHLTAAF